MSDKKPKRGRPPIPFDFSPYSAKRSYRQHAEFIRELQRKNGTLKAGRPPGFRVPNSKGENKSPATVPYSRICLEVAVMLDRARDAGVRLTEREAVMKALAKLTKRFGCDLRLQPKDPAVETTLNKIRAYRRVHLHEYPKRIKK